MSFRELRNFTEIMRSLGYPRQLSMESFRSPNFALVADILYWLVFRYDPLASLSDNIETPDDRVAFLKAATQIVASKARIRLKAKNLYAADGRAVREMLKLATVLYEAVTSGTSAEQDWGAGGDDDHRGEALASELASRLTDAASVRDQARTITEKGVTLYELLEEEEDNREERAKALRFLDAASSNLGHREEQAYVESCVRDAVREAEEQTGAMQRQIEVLEADEKALSSKLGKAKADLERSQQRLASIKNVRPAFMDQYEQLEQELAEEYASYVRKYRNLEYLESELMSLERREKDKAEASSKALRRLQAQLEEEAVRRFRGDEHVSDTAFADAAAVVEGGAGGRGRRGDPRDEDDDDDDGSAAAAVPVPRPRAAAGARPGGADGTRGGVFGGERDDRPERPPGPRRHVTGTMNPDDDDDDDDDEDDDEDEEGFDSEAEDLESDEGLGSDEDDIDEDDDLGSDDGF